MKLFLDTASISEIERLSGMGLIDGITTNPSIVAGTDAPFSELIGEICKLVSGPVSAEVIALDADGMIKQGNKLREIADNVAVKVPLTQDGLKACKALSDDGAMVNVTLCFSATQALAAAKAGASFISPFIGRLDDISIDGLELIQEIREIYDNYDFETKILAASVRNVSHVKGVAQIGADVATIPPAVMRSLIRHPLTDAGLKVFMDDWAKSGREV